MDYPRIRSIEAHPLEQEGKEMVLLRDTEGIMENHLVVSRDAVFLISLMDGTRSLRDIQAEYMRAFGELVHIEHIQKFVEAMDKNLLLFSENFKNHFAGLKQEYENDPIRKPYLAGKTYQANRMELLVFLNKMFNSCEDKKPKGRIAGILAPHIDYERGAEAYRETYSYLKKIASQGQASEKLFSEHSSREGEAGYPVAGGALLPEGATQAPLTDKPLLIILGTCHHPTEKILSMSLKDFSTPLGVLPNSKELCGLIKGNDILKNYIDEWPHRSEHSIELQLPLLQFIGQDNFEIFPILAGSMQEYLNGEKNIETDRELRDIIDNFKHVLHQYGKPYVIISGADLAHIGAQFGDRYPLDPLTLGQSRIKDEELLKCVGNVNAHGFFSAIQREGDRRRICGLTPIYFQLRLLESSLCEIVSYKQWTDGQSSVSFAGGIFYQK